MVRKFFVGVDISKKTLDVALICEGNHLSSLRIDNNEASVRQLLSQFKSEFKSTPGNTLYCAENMGLFANHLLKILQVKKYAICMESPLRLKRSLGILRGKNDAIDAVRIANYAYKNASSLRIWQPVRAEIHELKTLSSIRKKLLKTKLQLTKSKKLEMYFLSKKEYKIISGYSANSIKAIIADIEHIEKRMDEILNTDENLKSLMTIITSIPYVGQVIAREVIIATNEFLSFTSAKKFSSHCGIAPFTRTSGSSIKGKPRVSLFSNKELKTLLHLAAIGYVRLKTSFLGKYYIRKVNEGKNKMSVLNAIRNKIVHRIFACVRENKIFQDY